MKILYVTTVGITMRFFEQFIKKLLEEGHSVDIATNEDDFHVPECYRNWNCTVYQINTSRSPLSVGNVKAIKEIKKIAETNSYDIIHCHTPIAAMCTRLACQKVRKHGTRVIYTAHGFHFYKGAPKKNWLLFYPIEKICSYFTDVLITINREDFCLARERMCAKETIYVPGVGIDLSDFDIDYAERNIIRNNLGVSEEVVLFSVGELNVNKNHEVVIRAIADMDNICYLIAGEGALREHLTEVIASLGMQDRVHLLGFCDDLKKLYRAADVFVFPSHREGLSVSLMEAMASGLPVACSRIRGNVDLVDELGGKFFDSMSVQACRSAIMDVLAESTSALGKHNAEKVKEFSLEKVIEEMYRVYGLA